MSERSPHADRQAKSAEPVKSPPGQDEYLIQPRNKKDTKEYEPLLYRVVAENDVYTSASKRSGVLYWAMFLTPEQAEQLQHPSVIITKLVDHNPLADGTEWDPFGD